MNNNIYLKLQRFEAIANSQKAELDETILARYEQACAEQNAEDAAYFARKIRNKMLEKSDKELTFDRLGLTVPSGSTFTSWLSFLRNLGNVLSGSWATYRQELRDLPQQEGFPFNIIFPTPPSETQQE